MSDQARWFVVVKTPLGEQARVYHDFVQADVHKNSVFEARLDILPHWDELKEMSVTELERLYKDGVLMSWRVQRETVTIGFDEAPKAESLLLEHDEPDEPFLHWFRYDHLPEHLQPTSAMFYDLAAVLTTVLPKGYQRDCCFQKLVEAKDCGVRAMLHKPSAR